MQKLKIDSKKILSLLIASLTIVSLGSMNKVKAQENGGNLSCSDLGIDYQYSSGRINYNLPDNSFDQEFPEGLNVEVSESGTSVDWDSTFAIGAVILKGSDNHSVYEYVPQVYADSGLVTPTNNGGNLAALSNITFCWNDVEPTPTPTAEPTNTPGLPDVTPSPTVEPTTAPAGSTSSAIGNNGPSCDSNDFEVTMDLKDENGNPVEGVTVHFTYKNENKEAVTNNDGRASVTYGFSGEDSVEAKADGFATQSIFVKSPVCEVVNTAASNDSEVAEVRSNGQVLGASTLADTGMSLWQQALVLGLILSTISGISLVKNRK